MTNSAGARPLRCVLSYPGVMEHAQHAALALQEVGALEAFATAYAYHPGGGLDRAISLAPKPIAERIRGQLRRREVFPELADRTISFAGLEVARTLSAKTGLGPIWTDRVWDLSAHRFDQTVARRLSSNCEVMVGFEYTAEASFRRARALGHASVLHLPSLDSLAFKQLEDRETEEWPELRAPEAAYFEAKFERRYARRKREIELADMVIANSALTKASHVAAGADPAKIFVATLGAPTPVSEVTPAGPASAPLTVLWSGAFSLRKGAHYMLEAWRRLKAGRAARLLVYGQIVVPRRLSDTAPDGVEFLGSAPRPVVMDAYAGADVMVFPTLSDGFGMSVAEALSRGLPVITTDAAGAADLIEHEVNGLVIPAGDPEALAGALQWCLDNREALARMRVAALDSARRRQWSDYRRDVVSVMNEGLTQAGFAPLTSA